MPKVNIEGVARMIAESLEDYSEEVKNNIYAMGKNVAENTAGQLQAVSNAYEIHTGKYNRSWDVRDMSGKNYVRFVVHSKKPYYRLTHLLEKGHMKKDGTGRVEAREHIKPICEMAMEDFYNNTQKIIKGEW